jgi:hypothetical protein
MKYALILTFLLQISTASANGLFGNNKVDDVFAIKQLEGKQLVATGAPKGLKPGDILYSQKSPFKFTVTEVKGNSVTLTLPERHELKEGMSLLRMPTAPIKKAIETEARLKQALEE